MKSKFTLKKYLAALLIGSSVVGCATITNMVAPSTKEINEQSATAYQEFRTKNTGAIDTKSTTYKRINTIFNRMIPYANKLNQTGVPFQWQLTVFKSDTINAFAMPGGKIAFFTGLVDKLKLTDDEIAAIMGHEMIHALNEHSRKAYAGQLVTQGALSIGSVAVSVATGLDPNTVGALGSVVSQVGLTLPYSRSNETEADIEGLDLMATAGYNPRASLTLWKKMEAASSGSKVTPALLSTHPTNKDRYETLNKHMDKALTIYDQARAR